MATLRVLVKAPLNPYSGYGQDGIGIVRALLAAGVDVSVDPTFVSPPVPEEIARLLTRRLQGPFDLLIHHVDPAQLGLTTATRRLVGTAVAWTMWEYETCDNLPGRRQLRKRLADYDRVFGYDTVSAGALSRYVPDAKLGVLQGGFWPAEWPEVPRDWTGDRFGFAMVGALHERKDPFVAIEAFRELKQDKPDEFAGAELHLKTNILGLHPGMEQWIPKLRVHYCVDDQTEALTRAGWKRQSDLRDGDEIAAYDPDTDRVRWSAATFYRVAVDEDLVKIEKRVTSQRLTASHRCLIKTVRRQEPHVRSAGELSGSCFLPLSAPWDDVDGTGPGEKMAALLGWFISEGSMREQHARQAFIYQSETANPSKVAEIRELLDALGVDYYEKRRARRAGESRSPRDHVMVTFVLRDCEVTRWLREHGTKRLEPSVVFGWSRAECEALLQALIDGDGTRKAAGWTFVQKDRDCAEMVQCLALRCGYRAVLRQHRRHQTYTVTIGRKRWVTLHGANNKIVPIERERYRGIVWCPTVSTGFWLARRNGAPFITGNSVWTDEVLREFYAAQHVLLAPSRGEGKNLPALEFQSTGGAVIATNWGGHSQWLSREYAYPLDYTLAPVRPSLPGCRNARASKDHLKQLMWHVYTHREEARRKGELAAQIIPRMCHWHAVVDRLFTQLGHDVPGGDRLAAEFQRRRDHTAGSRG